MCICEEYNVILVWYEESRWKCGRYFKFSPSGPIQLHSGVIHLHASGVEGLVSVLVLQQGHDLVEVQAPPVQQEGGMWGGLVHAPSNLFGFGVIGEVPGFGLAQEVDHFGIATVSGRNAGIDLFFIFSFFSEKQICTENATVGKSIYKDGTLLVPPSPLFTATFGILLLFVVSCWCNIRIMSPPCGRLRKKKKRREQSTSAFMKPFANS